MIDTAHFTTAFIIIGVTFAAVIAVGIGIIVSYARRTAEATAANPAIPAATGEPATAAERREQLVG